MSSERTGWPEESDSPHHEESIPCTPFHSSSLPISSLITLYLMESLLSL